MYKDKLRRDPTPEKSDSYKLKMELFDNSDPEEFLFFVWHFQMTLEASGALADITKIQYFHTLLCGKELNQLDPLSIEVGSTTTTYLNHIILVLGTYPFHIDVLSKQNCVVHSRMRNPRKLKVI